MPCFDAAVASRIADVRGVDIMLGVSMAGLRNFPDPRAALAKLALTAQRRRSLFFLRYTAACRSGLS